MSCVININQCEHAIDAIKRHFISTGHIVKDGAKFGGDLLIYPSGGPKYCHSKNIIEFDRTCNQVAKIALLAVPFEKDKIRLLTVNQKKKDYKQRSQRYHVLERNIKELAAKARYRNEDEFNFKMVHGKLGNDGHVILENDTQQKMRKMSRKQLLEHQLSELDKNRFILKHQLNTLHNKLDKFVTDNSVLMRQPNTQLLDESPVVKEELPTSKQNHHKCNIKDLNVEAQIWNENVRQKVDTSNRLENQRIIKIAQYHKRRIISLRSKNQKRIIAIASERNK
ncbi:bifunctional tRNA intron endonuclease [Babesia duncani]|uniref:tRNA-intron lyase n=1 Tax=Babesia duncani TaxID=323732 RepID=A0AAD9PLV9_9APIC|nr:bifunctional tRNA intron endonuclease [Babesia duncani]